MRHWTDQRIMKERRRKKMLAILAGLAILAANMFILLTLIGCIFGCVTVEKVQVGPADWPTFKETTYASTTRPNEEVGRKENVPVDDRPRTGWAGLEHGLD